VSDSEGSTTVKNISRPNSDEVIRTRTPIPYQPPPEKKEEK